MSVPHQDASPAVAPRLHPKILRMARPSGIWRVCPGSCSSTARDLGGVTAAQPRGRLEQPIHQGRDERNSTND